ncbi:hypothetical protein M404DRAFT_1001699 [Pisolithus tinctorius Marx 270]|uniref:Uncharacterized protein n=1 Tax=Pisolithus tinctorius Marx 270 TaxID=870435 RepID=A0A0C3P690_PISTI|nr:hypothetical protein M404DRAFT_1001699 [Pisolithus tinctorius Marx 270]
MYRCIFHLQHWGEEDSPTSCLWTVHDMYDHQLKLRTNEYGYVYRMAPNVLIDIHNVAMSTA